MLGLVLADCGNPAKNPGKNTRVLNTSCVAPSLPPFPLELTNPFANLELPAGLLHLTRAPGDDQNWFAVLRDGRVLKFANDPNVSTNTVFLDIGSRVDDSFVEMGLLGLAFHPDFPTTNRVFAFYTATRPDGQPGNRLVLAEYQEQAGQLNPASETRLLELDKTVQIHNGGTIAFGPDGYLYVTIGDSSPQGDTLGNGQNKNNLFGSMLRLDVDGGSPYAIPPDNPFAGGGGAPEIFAWGLRNTWKWSFDSVTGLLWGGDVGNGAWEEVNIIEKGGNYGWAIMEGAECAPAGGNASCDPTGLIDPEVALPHNFMNSITGGYIYRGTEISELIGQYVFADFVNGQIFAYDSESGEEPTIIVTTALQVAGFATDPDEELLVIGFQGQIRKLSPVIGEEVSIASVLPRTLKKSGCFNFINNKPNPGVTPYEIRRPFWSDGVAKGRLLALPGPAQIGVKPDGNFDFPIGSVLIKHFDYQGKRIETRLIMRHDENLWGGYSYKWRADQKDADLLTEAVSVELEPGGQTYHYPSREQCLQCHTPAAGFVLGPGTAQFNIPYRQKTLPFTNQKVGYASQLRKFHQLGYFKNKPDFTSQLPEFQKGGGIAEKARTYLAVNCAMCHQPGGGAGRAEMDFRLSTSPETDMNICDQVPQAGTMGITGARVVAPGQPDKSLVYERMRSLDPAWRMAPIGSTVRDSTGLKIIRDWISRMNSDCRVND